MPMPSFLFLRTVSLESTLLLITGLLLITYENNDSMDLISVEKRYKRDSSRTLAEWAPSLSQTSRPPLTPPYDPLGIGEESSAATQQRDDEGCDVLGTESAQWSLDCCTGNASCYCMNMV
jgi:hypothetical protein